MTKTNDSWLTVDRKGLGQLLERKGKGFAAVELVSNALDEPGVTTVTVALGRSERRGHAWLTVEDDAPAGFLDLTHSHTLFAPSKKKGEAELRGRFNLGEKLVLAVAREATIISTTGTVRFAADGTRTFDPKNTRPNGTHFCGELKMTLPELGDALALLATVIVPDGQTVIVNGDPLPNRTPVRTTKSELPTEAPDEEGAMRRVDRVGRVDLYEPLDGETPTIYELGIPVVEHDGRWHIDIGQKVPLNMERDNVTPAYLRKLRTIMIDVAADMLTAEQASASWATDGLAKAKPEAVERVLTARFGTKRVAFDPTNPEANKRAVDQGYSLIHGGTFDRKTWAAVRTTGTVQAAGKVIATGVQTSPNGKPPIPEAEWTEGMKRVARYAAKVCEFLTGVPVNVEITNQAVAPAGSARYAAAWHKGFTGSDLKLNVGTLGHGWFNNPNQEAIDALLIHESAHQKADDHFTAAFYDECCRLGAKLRSCTVKL